MATITVATLNLRGRHDHWLRRRHLVVAALLDALPDLVSLQEISFPIGQGRWLRNQLNYRLGTAAAQPYHLLQQRKSDPVQGLLEGIGILTRLPVIAHDALSLGYGRVALRANIELPNHHMLDFVATHLHHITYDQEVRYEQAMLLTGWLNDPGRAGAARQIVAGDLNEVPTGPAIRQMKQVYRSAFAECHGYEPPATFPTVLVEPEDPTWSGCLDYIFLSPGIGRVHSARIFANKHAADDDRLYPSDHVGVLATVEV